MGRGNNHRHNCQCGWCTSTWANAQIDRGALSRSIAQGDALRLLRDFRASGGGAACFVNPNAQCPVCGAAVFYYQNEHGSRVYFDQLGPPWPKHPCTNVAQQREPVARAPRPAARLRGERIELLGAARRVGRYDEVRVDPSGYPIDWQTVEVLEIHRSESRTLFKGRLLHQTREEHIVYFSVDEGALHVDVGDVLSACFSHVSFFDMKSFGVRTLAVRWYGDERFSQAITVAEHPIQQSPGNLPKEVRRRIEPRGKTTLIRRERAPEWLKRENEKRRNKRHRKNMKKQEIRPARPARTSQRPTAEPKPDTDIDRQEMIEMLSKRYRISVRKKE